MEDTHAFPDELQKGHSTQDWNWWPRQGPSTAADFSDVEAMTSIPPAENTHLQYASDYGEDWLAEQLANIPMLTGDGSEPNEIIQVNQNSADGTGYVLVADRELAAILGGHVDRDTIYWLLANFKLERNAVMPRGFLYSKYEAFCNAHGKLLMNQACMGKTVRALFRGLETRRLGRRGKSRYHYIGLAINPEGEFAGMVPLEPEEPAPEPGEGERKRRRISRTTTAVKKTYENPVGKQFENMDPDNRLEVALEQLDKLLNVRRNRALIPFRLRQETHWRTLLPFDQHPLPEGMNRNDIYAILRDFKVHLGLLGHSMISGVLLAISSILENFWTSHITSLQIPETFDSQKFALALMWPPFLEFVGLSFIELYGAVIEQLLPKMDKAINTQTLDFLYEMASKYGQWVKACACQLSLDIQFVLNSSAITFCQTLKQMVVLNSSLGLVDLVERDRSKATVVAEGFRALSDRLILIANATQTPEQLALAVQNIGLMEFIAGNDCMLQRWRGWVHNVVSLKLTLCEQKSEGMSETEVILLKEAVLADIRQVWMGLLSEMQKNVERSGRDYATPMTYVLSYYIHYANYALDNFQANLHKMTMLQYGYQMTKHVLQTTEYLNIPATPVYEITFFAHRFITNININVYDFHYYGNFDELRSIIYLPNFGALTRTNFSVLPNLSTDSFNDSFHTTDRTNIEEFVDFDGSNSFPVYHAHDAILDDQDMMALEAIEAAANLGECEPESSRLSM